MRKGKYLIVILLSFALQKVKAQNDLHFSHFMFNMLTYNPAVAGNSNFLEGNLVARKQWVGFNGAPTLGILNAHTYLHDVRGGVGLTVVNDHLGFENILTFRGNYAYHLRLKDGHDIAGGIGLGFNYKSIDPSKFILDDANDAVAANIPKSKIVPDVNFGFEYNHKYVTAGLASTHIQQGIGSSNVFNIPRHYYLYAKGYFHANEQIVIVPSVLTKTTSFISQLEVNIMGIYQNKYWFGTTFRTKEALSFIAGIAISPKLKIGYSYDFTAFTKLRTFNSGSHEIMIAFRGNSLSKKHYHLKTPRFFN